MKIIDNDLLSIQESRILIENASEAQKTLASFSQEKLDEIVERIAEEISKHCYELAFMSHEETGYGKCQDKYIKNKLICKYLPEKLRGMKCVGIISEDKENKTMNVGVPVGVIVALIPSTSPVSTTIYNTLIAIKSSNSIVFSPHPRAKNTISKVLDIIIKVAEGYGLPSGAISYLHTTTIPGTIALMNHNETALIINTGVPKMLNIAYKSGKSVIYGGNGSGPAFIERSANIKQAVIDIIKSRSFDNGILPGSEQFIVVDSCVASDVKIQMEKHGAYFMSEEESVKLTSILFLRDGSLDSQMIGKSAIELAKKAGFIIPSNTLILVSKQKYVLNNSLYLKENMSPVLFYYIEDDWMNACEKCIELLLSERNGHTLVIHSNNEEVIKHFILKKPVGRVLINTPSVFGSIGITTNLFPALTLGSSSSGKGITSDNVSPMNLIYVRKVGYGVRCVDELDKYNILDENKECLNISNIEDKNYSHSQVLKLVLEKIIKEIG